MVEAPLVLRRPRGGRRRHRVGRDRARARRRAARPAGDRNRYSRRRLVVARANAVRLGLDVEFLEGDLLAGTGALDAVVSNPPYVRAGDRLPPEITRHEPASALFGGPDGLEVIRRLVSEAPTCAAAALEVGRGRPRRRGAAAAGWRVEGERDLAGIARVAVGPEIRGVRGLRRRRRRRGLPGRHRVRPRLRPREPRRRRAALRGEGARAGQARARSCGSSRARPRGGARAGPRTRALLARLLPGGVTLVLPNPRGRYPLAGGEALGLRVPDVPLLRGVGRPVLQSSANLTGGPDARRSRRCLGDQGGRRPGCGRRGAAGDAVDGRRPPLFEEPACGPWCARARCPPRPSPQRHECRLDRPYAGRADIRRGARALVPWRT